MKALRKALDEVLHLFVDDGSLAAFALVLVVLVGGAVKVMDVPPLYGALALLVGAVAILVESLNRAAKGARK